MSDTTEIKAPAIDPEEFSVAEKEAAASNAGAYVHTFDPPFQYEGKTYEELTFDFGRLTGKDFVAISNELMSRGKVVAAPEFSVEFQERMAAHACTTPVGVDVLEAMPIGSFNRILSRARSFLLRTAL